MTKTAVNMLVDAFFLCVSFGMFMFAVWLIGVADGQIIL